MEKISLVENAGLSIPSNIIFMMRKFQKFSALTGENLCIFDAQWNSFTFQLQLEMLVVLCVIDDSW